MSTGTRAKLRFYDTPLSICAHAHVLGIEVEAQRQLSPSLTNFTCYPVSRVREGLRALVAKENLPLSESTDLKCPAKAHDVARGTGYAIGCTVINSFNEPLIERHTGWTNARVAWQP